MSILKEEIIGDTIKNEIKSSNIIRSEYNTTKKIMSVTFSNGSIYQYFDVPHNEYTKFRMSESKGSYFKKNIEKNYKYAKK